MLTPATVGEALVRYVNSGVTLGAVNLPEVNLRSLTPDEHNHARVSSVDIEIQIILTRSGYLYPS